MHSGQVESNLRCGQSLGRQRWLCYRWLEVRCVFNRHLKVASVLDSLIAAGNLFHTVGAEKLKEGLLKLVVQEGICERF